MTDFRTPGSTDTKSMIAFATRMVMARRGCTFDEAYALLTDAARS